MIKLSDIRHAQHEKPTEHTETEITWEVIAIAALCFLALIGFICVLLFLVWLAANESYAPIIGILLVCSGVFVLVLVTIKKEKG